MIYVRAIHFAATLSASGIIFFAVFVAAPAFRGANAAQAFAALRARLALIAWLSLGLVLISGVAWFVLTAAAMSDQPLPKVFSDGVLWTVLSRTDFGNAWLARFLFACLLGCAFVTLLSGRRFAPRWIEVLAVISAAALVGGLAWAGHAVGGSGVEAVIHPSADVLHLVAAAAWIGTLVPLALLLTAAEHDGTSAAIARTATVRFSTLGIVSVGTLLVTGTVNTWYLAGSVPALVGTYYGRLLLTKVALFFAMVTIAAVNRLRFTPRLTKGASSATAREILRRLRRNTVIETLIGAIIIAIVAVLGTNPPGLHQQPIWPFALRFNPTVFNDPQLHLSLLMTLNGIAAGAFIVFVGVLFRQVRWPAIAFGIVAMVYFAASLRAFTTAAFPTTYYVSPVPFTAESIADGKSLFAAHCASCHGAEGRGDGPAGNAATTKPADLTADHVYDHSDGDLFWWISNGIGGVMPPLGPVLDDQARWNVINFVRANADAAKLRGFGAGANVTFPSSAFSANCADGSTIAVDQNIGRIVHIVLARTQDENWLRQIARIDAEHDVATVVVAADWAPKLDLPICFTQDPNVLAAFVLYADADFKKAAMKNKETAEFLVDGAGNIRALWYAGREPDTDGPDALLQRLSALESPGVGRPGSTHMHMH